MALTFILSIIVAVVQTVLCGFSFWICIDYIVVILFCLRLVGATFRVKILCIVELVPLALWLLWTFMFGGWEHWPQMLIFLGCNIATCGIMIYEDVFYVITEKEVRRNDDDSDR